jgi:ClpA/ClpB-like protein
VTAETPRIQRASFHEAQRLGHHWVGPEHGLLAILRGDPEDVARQVLEEAGLAAAMLERQLEGMNRGPKDGEPARGAVTNPAWHHAYGRAEGLALGLGDGVLQPVHLLLALLWDRWHWQFPEQQGVSREAVVEALRSAGMTLPSAPMPELELPIKIDPGAEPNSCQFCGGPIQEGRRFIIPAKDRTWVAFFCSPHCALGFGVCALVRGGMPRDPALASLAVTFGEGGAWMQALHEEGVISPDLTA